MVKAYEGKLSEFVIPVEELGFDPLVPTNTDWGYKFIIIIISKFHLSIKLSLIIYLYKIIL